MENLFDLMIENIELRKELYIINEDIEKLINYIERYRNCVEIAGTNYEKAIQYLGELDRGQVDYVLDKLRNMGTNKTETKTE